MTPYAISALANRISQLLDNKEFCDLQIRCKDKTWHVHKAVIASSGGYFGSVVKKGFQAGATNIINLEDGVQDMEIRFAEAVFDPNVIQAVLEHLYGRLYVPPFGEHHAKFHAKIYFAGDYFQLPSLKHEARYNFYELAVKGASTTLADQWRRRGVPKELLEAAEIVYSVRREDRGLKDILVYHIKSHLGELCSDFGDGNEILENVPGLAYDLLHARIISNSDGTPERISIVLPSSRDLDQVRTERQCLIEHLIVPDENKPQWDHWTYLIFGADDQQTKKRKRND